MAFQTPITIKEALENISSKAYALPAIQRELVWDTDKIVRFFDSLMQGYPIGSFLFWKIKPENIKNYQFYGFVQDYHERNARYCPKLDPNPRTELTGILDGQQRLTALYIGLRGSHATRVPGRWRNNPNAFPELRLYINLISYAAPENEAGLRYDFQFMSDEQAKDKRDDKHYWYLVGKILEANEDDYTYNFLEDKELTGKKRYPNTFKILARLRKVIHSDGIISYYEEKDQDLNKVLNIFIRTNSGGTTLSHSDLLMSIATAQWDKLDARKEIRNTIDIINNSDSGRDFDFSRDFVLKAGLMLADIPTVDFQVANFTKDKMAKLQDNWSSITDALETTVKLVASFGFSKANLSANSSLHPIAYYIHKRKFSGNFYLKNAHKEDRDRIERWLKRSLLKRGVWGGSSDSLLAAIRTTIKDHEEALFPVEEIEGAMRRRGKDLRFSDDELQDLVDTSYKDGRAFVVLSMLYPFTNIRDNNFEIDHIFPKSHFHRKKLQNMGANDEEIDTYKERVDLLANLQLLTGGENRDKGNKTPSEWVEKQYQDPNERVQHILLHDLGELPNSITGFNKFYEDRRTRMLEKLRTLLND